MGRITRWKYDLQGRVTEKVYADGSKITSSYDPATGWLASIANENGEFKHYEYYPDGALKVVHYPNARVPTPSVQYLYDADTGLVKEIRDGAGTIRFAYRTVGTSGALRLASIDGPWENDTLTFTYDSLGRITSRSIAGVSESWSFDVLGRITNIVNRLGSFQYAYDGVTARASEIRYPNGQRTAFNYFGPDGSRRLKAIVNRSSDQSLLSQFDYTHDAVGDIQAWRQILGTVSETWTVGHDDARQLTSVDIVRTGGASESHRFDYDLAGNRLLDEVNGARTTFAYNSLNELTTVSTGQVQRASYEWDGEKRLVAIEEGERRSEFAYDYQGRWVRLVEKTNGVTESEKRFVWCGTGLCEERTGTDQVQVRFFSQGEEGGTELRYHSHDHLGSVWETTTASGALLHRMRYGPWGQHTLADANSASRRGFTGLYRHEPSGLNLAVFRQYEATTGRWLSRDPLGEQASVNLYAYVGNNPTGFIDPLGLIDEPGFGESLVPVWGSSRQAFHEFGEGNYLSGTLYTGLAATDVVLVKSLLQGIGKVFGKVLFGEGGYVCLRGGTSRSGPVIIGETISRVEEAAARIPGAVFLDDMPDFIAMGMNADEVTSAMMQYNRKWLLEQLRNGRQIIDIGTDINRAVPSIFYRMENNMIRNYQKLHPEFNNLIRR